MLMSMLYDINFIIGLLITLLLSTFAYFYFSQKIEEQNEKLNAVSMVVRAMAEEIAYFRNGGQAATFLEKAQPTQEGGSALAETKVFEIGLANIGINGSTNNIEERSNELQLIAVSDDEDSDSDSSDSSDDHSGSDSDSEDDDTELCSVSNVDVEAEDLEMLDGGLIDKSLEDYKKEENFEPIERNEPNEFNGNIKSIKLDLNVGDLEEFGIFEGLGDNAGKLDVTETKVVDDIGLKSLIDEDHMKAGSTDYKKMSLGKLRMVVVEKKLCEDASKMKKHELLELLKPFIGNMD